MGTGDFAVPPLAAINLSRHEIIGVISQPDRPRGRGRKIEPTPVKRFGTTAKLQISQPEKLNDPKVKELMADWRPDIIVVASYGKILPDWIIEAPPLGAINIHGSVLPAYRGAAPIQRAIINGETRTGVTIVKITPEVDAGDILLTAETDIEADETAGDLFNKLAALGAAVIVGALDTMDAGEAEWRQQPKGRTYAPKIEKAEARIKWNDDAINIKNLARGLNPNPGAFFMRNNDRVKLWRASARPADKNQTAGLITELISAGPVVACGQGELVLTELQPAGKGVMSGAEYIRGYRPQPGDMLK
jgi:methionyl-tRNA formyltransferase